ncbi:MAG: DUF58 domain-containing protein [Arthrobacter sp.]|uniref:DUF58 domain-containing protein n=1 Tax=Arthrobacter sp. TaxID=1667 RepID=UPI00346B0513
MSASPRRRSEPARLAAPARSQGWGIAVVLALALGVGSVVAARPDVAALAGLFGLLCVSSRSALPSGSAPTLSFGHRVPSADGGEEGDGPGGEDTGDGRRVATFGDPVERRAGGAAPARGPLLVLRGRAPGSVESAVVCAAGESVGVALRMPYAGRREILSYAVSTASADLGLCRDESEPGALVAAREPAPVPLRRLPLPARLRSHAGAHHGPLRGGGSAVRDLDRLRPGDDLRRIDWRATARSAETDGVPLVRHHHAPADAGLVLAVDARADVPQLVAGWINPEDVTLSAVSSLQLTRAAAGTLAAAYLSSGDRVGLMDPFGFSAPLRPAAGFRQLEILRRRLAALGVPPSSLLPSRPASPPPGTLVCLLSPFLETDAADRLAQWFRSGHVVAAVDTLPRLDTEGLTVSQARALAVLLAGREASLARLREEGIEVLPVDALAESLDSWSVRRARSGTAAR